MPANTPRGFPYPLPAEPVAEGAQAIRNLAEAIDAKEAGRELAYAERQTDTPGVATGIGATVITSPAVACDGVFSVLVEFFSPGLQANVGGNSALYFLQDGAQAGNIGGWPARSEQYPAIYARRRLTPAAGSHTWGVSFLAVAAALLRGGNGIAAAYAPAHIRVIRL